MSVDLPEGTRLAQYRVERVVGRGATGVVYLAHEEQLERPVALKLLADELSGDARFRERFLRESLLAAGIEHPHMLPVYAAGDVGGDLFIAMRFVEEGDLAGVISRQGRLDPDQAVGIVAAVADALDAAHRRGLIHRDVKPGNILVDGAGNAYLADFGLAADTSERSGETGFAGTLTYAAPEQIRGDVIDGRADLYALGCVLFECLTGRPPFQATSPAAVLFAHLEQDPPALSALRPDLPKSLDAVFACALAKEPDDRFPTGAAMVAAVRAALGGKARGRRRWALLTAAVVVAAAAGAALQLGGGDAPAPAFAAHSVGAVDIATRQPAGDVRLGQDSSVVSLDGAIWAATGDGGLYRINPSTLATRRVDANAGTAGIVAASGYIWELSSRGTRLRRIEPAYDTSRAFRLPGREGLVGVAAGDGAVWVLQNGPVERARVLRIDPANGHVTARFRTRMGWPSYIAYDDGAVYIAQDASGSLIRLNANSGRVDWRQRLHGWVAGLAAAGGAVWLSVGSDLGVWRFDEDSGRRLGLVHTGLGAGPLAEAGSTIWVSNRLVGTVTGIDLSSLRPRTIAIGHAPGAVALAGGKLWVPMGASAPSRAASLSGHSAKVAHFALWEPFGTPDFAATSASQFQPPGQFEVAYATQAKLYTYHDPDAAHTGAELVPEIAAAMPSTSVDGRTVTIPVRPGYRLSPPSGEVVTAETMRHSIERALAPTVGGAGATVIDDIAGEAAFRSGLRPHISGLSVHGSALVIKLTRRDPLLAERLATPPFAAVPADAPYTTIGDLPSAGPYYLASSTDTEAVLKRNPYYTGSRPHRLDSIIYGFGLNTRSVVTGVEHGRFDYVSGWTDPSTALSPTGKAALRFGPGSTAAARRDQRWFEIPQLQTWFYFLNTHHGVFRSPRMRQAMRSVVDSQAFAAAAHGTPTGRLIPATLPPFARAPAMSADLRRAHRLARPFRGRRVIEAECGPGCQPWQPLMEQTLRSLGLRVEVRNSGDSYRKALRTGQWDVIDDGWYDYSDLADAGQPFADMFQPGTAAGVLPPHWQAQLDAANALSGSARVHALASFDGRLETQYIPIVAATQPGATALFSERLGCIHFSPTYPGVDIGELCVHGTPSH